MISTLLLLNAVAFGWTGNPAARAWQNWVASENARLKTSQTSFLNLADAVYLKKGQTTWLAKAPISEKSRWLTERPARELLSVQFDGAQALLIAGKESIELLKEKKTWLAPGGLVIAADKLKDGDLRVRAHFPGHPAQATFQGLRFFPFDGNAFLTAKFVPAYQARTMQLPTVRNRTQKFYVAGLLHFTLNGKQAWLSAFTAEEPKLAKQLFVPFRDASNGNETYAGGRYLDVDVADAAHAKELGLDFNRAYNPYCARSKLYNCVRVTGKPLPAAIRAGELAPLRNG